LFSNQISKAINLQDNQHLLINKNLHKTIFGLSVPGMISSVLMTMFQLVDAYWVGKLGAGALAAIGGSAFVLWAIFSLTAISSTGIATLVAQKIGAGREDDAKVSAGQGMILNTITAIVLSTIVYLIQDYIYLIMGFDSLVTPLAKSYMSILLIGLIIPFWFTGLEAVFRGLGDTKTPTIIVAITLVLNALLDPVFIFGWLGMPNLGVGGAAMATVLAHGVSVVLCLYFLKRKKFNPEFRSGINMEIMYRMFNIGAPIAFGGFIFSIIYVFLTNIIARFGTEAIAAIGVCHRIEGIAWFACVGFSVAASTLVGQNVGAQRIDQAWRAAFWVNGYATLILFFVSGMFYFYPDFLMSIFTNDPSVQQYGIEYLRIIAVFEIFLGFEVIMEGVFSGAGYTMPVMLVTVPLSIARIPLAWLFAIHLGWGASGIWWAIGLTTFLKGLLNTILFAMGLWKRKIPLSNE
jgi:putative MATE family efflux protein